MKLPTALLLCTLFTPRASAARAAEPAPSLPASAAVTNLRSLSGRTVYLLLRARPDLDVPTRAAQVAAPLGAKASAHAVNALWVVSLQHPSSALVVRRLGPELRVDLAPNPLLDPQIAAVVRLPADRPEEDYDQEIMLRALQSFREGDHVPPMMVSLAQGAASRVFLRHVAAGDEIRAALWGRRHTALLSAHPDARLLLELVTETGKALEVDVQPEGEAAASPTPESEEFDRWSQEVRAVLDRARQRVSRDSGREIKDKDKEKEKEKTHE